MIHTVRIQNFKNILDQTIELDRLTIFVGANGSGKSSVLEAIDLITNAKNPTTNGMMTRFAQLEWVYTRGASKPLGILCETEKGFFELSLKITRLQNPAETVNTSFDDTARMFQWGIEVKPSDEKLFAAQQTEVRPLVYLKLNASRLAAPSYSDVTHPRLEPDGGGAASVLAFMALNDPDAFDELMDHVRGLLPQIKRIRFRKVPVQRTEVESIKIGSDTGERQTHRTFQGEAILFDFQNASDVAAHTASEGTLMILGLLIVLLGPDRPKVLLLDDIEHGLHPLAQKQLVDVIGRIMDKFPDLQILATAHSPYLLNYLAPEQVRIMATDSQGYSRCGRLTDHPKFATWKDEMAPGEMWSLFGEKWLAGAETGS